MDNTLYASDFDSLPELLSIKWAMGIIEHFSSWAGTDAYTALASQDIIYIGWGGWISWSWWNLFSEVSDLADLSWLEISKQQEILKQMWFK
jgi:hypothetical protein